MATSIQSIVDEISKVLRDETGGIVGAYDVDTEILPFINDSFSDILTDCPMANPVTVPFATAASTLQTLTADALALIDVRRNLGANGTTVGKVITKTSEDALDASRPTWPTDVCGAAGVPATPTHYITNPKSPRRFYLWPTPAHPWFVETIAAVVPADVSISDDYPLPDMFVSSTKAYVISHVLARRDKDMLAQSSSTSAAGTTTHSALLTLINYWSTEYSTSLKAATAAIMGTVPRDVRTL